MFPRAVLDGYKLPRGGHDAPISRPCRTRKTTLRLTVICRKTGDELGMGVPDDRHPPTTATNLIVRKPHGFLSPYESMADNNGTAPYCVGSSVVSSRCPRTPESTVTARNSIKHKQIPVKSYDLDCILYRNSYDSVMKETNLKDCSSLGRFIRNRKVVWYGPHACNGCGATIIKSSIESGGLALDAPHGHHYPNHKWVLHRCATPEEVQSTQPNTEVHECPQSST